MIRSGLVSGVLGKVLIYLNMELITVLTLIFILVGIVWRGGQILLVLLQIAREVIEIIKTIKNS